MTKGPKALNADATVLDRLHEVVDERKNVGGRRSHSARLLGRGTQKVTQKLGEEIFECLIEAAGGDKRKLAGECADVLYHLVVLWVDQGISPDEVWRELERREGTSGLEEKRARLAPGAEQERA